MDLLSHFQMLARYNAVANERLYGKCAELLGAEYRKHRQGSPGSIHALLNHILPGDRIWMARFEGDGQVAARLNTVLSEDFAELRSARIAQDLVPVAFAHFFNHQTHHRGQAHAMLSQTAVIPPSLDLHRIINP